MSQPKSDETPSGADRPTETEGDGLVKQVRPSTHGGPQPRGRLTYVAAIALLLCAVLFAMAVIRPMLRPGETTSPGGASTSQVAPNPAVQEPANPSR